MLKLVEILNTLPKSVCRVVLFAESKDDRSQAALEEFQSKAGFVVAGGSFIYDCDKEIIVTATDGQLGPDGPQPGEDMYYTLDDISSLDVDEGGELLRAPHAGIVHVSLAGINELSDSELKNKMYNIIRGLLIHNIGVTGVDTLQEVIDLPYDDEVPLSQAGIGDYTDVADSSEIVVEVTDGGIDEYVTDDTTFGGWLEWTDLDSITFGDLRTPTFGPLPHFFTSFRTK